MIRPHHHRMPTCTYSLNLEISTNLINIFFHHSKPGSINLPGWIRIVAFKIKRLVPDFFCRICIVFKYDNIRMDLGAGISVSFEMFILNGEISHKFQKDPFTSA